MARSAHNTMHIGILGGTFNPIHLGHINLAKYAAKRLCLKKVIFVPAYIPPHKKIAFNIPPKHRLNMVRAAIKNKKNFSLSQYEIRKKGKSYTINTIKYFKKKFGPGAEIFFLIGTDSLKGIYAWKDIREAMRLAQFAVAARPGYAFKRHPAGIREIKMPGRDISSTEIRNLIRKNKSIKKLVPKAVAKYIEEKKLYTC